MNKQEWFRGSEELHQEEMLNEAEKRAEDARQIAEKNMKYEEYQRQIFDNLDTLLEMYSFEGNDRSTASLEVQLVRPVLLLLQKAKENEKNLSHETIDIAHVLVEGKFRDERVQDGFSEINDQMLAERMGWATRAILRDFPEINIKEDGPSSLGF
jgi:hypothetical protein